MSFRALPVYTSMTLKTRRLYSFNMVSLDGFFAGPNGEIDWFNTDAEFSAFNIEQMKRGPGGILFGRVTYQLMASYWPTATEEPIVADQMNSLPKVVFSRVMPEGTGVN